MNQLAIRAARNLSVGDEVVTTLGTGVVESITEISEEVLRVDLTDELVLFAQPRFEVAVRARGAA